jgi:hypothetical protein
VLHRLLHSGGRVKHPHDLSLRDIAGRLVIAKGKKKGQHPAPATVLRMLREHDEKAAAEAVPAGGSPAVIRFSSSPRRARLRSSSAMTIDDQRGR